jgi:hypothetical protein
VWVGNTACAQTSRKVSQFPSASAVDDVDFYVLGQEDTKVGKRTEGKTIASASTRANII